jgi:hypothetical protein
MTKPTVSARVETRAARLLARRDNLLSELAEVRGEIRALALEMRDSGASYDEIGYVLGVSHVRAWKWVNPSDDPA